MGSFLSKPITIKESNECSCNFLKCGYTAMQGWRAGMEDALLVSMDLEPNSKSLFGVFDGHGGSEVALFIAKHLIEELQKSEHWVNGQIGEAFRSTFLSLDETIQKDETVNELEILAEEQREKVSKWLEEVATKEEEEEEDYVDEEIKNVLVNEVDKIEDDNSNKIDHKQGEKRLKGNESALDDQDQQDDNIENNIDVNDAQGLDAEKDDFNSEEKQKDEERDENDEGNGDDDDEEEEEIGERNNDDDDDDDDEEVDDEDEDDDDEDDDEFFDFAGIDAAEIKQLVEEHFIKSLAKGDIENVGNEDDNENTPIDTKVTNESDKSKGQGIESTEETQEPLKRKRKREKKNVLYEKFNKKILRPGFCSGSTAVVALVDQIKKTLIVANAGDSRCILCRNGKVFEMSLDHKPTDDIEKNRIEKAGGKVLEDRVEGDLNLSRAIGDHRYKRNENLNLKEQMISSFPDIKEISLTESDSFMVLASDGIWNFLDSQQVIDFVKNRMEKSDSLSSICNELCDACLAPNIDDDNLSTDNMTVIIVKFCFDDNSKTFESKSEEKNGEIKSQESVVDSSSPSNLPSTIVNINAENDDVSSPRKKQKMRYHFS